MQKLVLFLFVSLFGCAVQGTEGQCETVNEMCRASRNLNFGYYLVCNPGPVVANDIIVCVGEEK